MKKSVMKMQSKQPQYKFYATLLDSFSYMLKSEYDSAFQDFINKVNRVAFMSEAAEKGTAFNELVDKIAHEQAIYLPDAKGNIAFKGFSFKDRIVSDFVTTFRFSTPQVFTEAILPTSRGNVLLYGFIDEVMPGGVISDIKCTGSYTYPKFLGNWQHLVYPYCMRENGMDLPYFTYQVTDYTNIYAEDYLFKPDRDIERLQLHCEHLIDFLETHRPLITDKKVFALDEPKKDDTRNHLIMQ